MQNFPKKSAAADACEFAVDSVAVIGFKRRYHQLQCGHNGQRNHKRIKPFRAFFRKQSIHENAGKRRRNNTDQRGNQRREHYECNCGFRSAQAAYCKRKNAFSFTRRREFFVRFKHQADACKRLVEGLHRNGITSLRRVVDDSLFSLESVKHDEMIEIPVNDLGKAV